MSDSTHRYAAVSGKKVLVAILIILAFALGYYLPHWHEREATPVVKTEDTHDHSKEAKPTLWTCAMHPQIRLPNPGKCPICFMELIPLETGKEMASDVSLVRYSMSEAAKKLAEVQTTPVNRRQAKVVVRMVGQVYEDETRQAVLTSRVDGRLDEIYINFTGVSVNKGDPMVKIWSPTLIKSQVELFETMRSDTDQAVLKGAEEKLIQYGLTQDQIEEIKQKKKPNLYVTLRAPINGIVTKKLALLGQFVKEGQEMYVINDFSKVWVKMDAYETDLPWIRFGQDVTFTTPAAPGRKFNGKVLFIDPMLDTKTRSVKVRVEADNPDLTLKTGMFVSAELHAEVDSKGRVIKSEWAGKYVCPVHPSDQASSEPGFCPESKAALRPASSFGYADDPNPELPLVIPASAPLITGKRSIVYVEVPGDQPTYELREVSLGPRAGDQYVVYEGLKEGERVVTKGNFKIDSAMQILAKSSMMAPTDDKPGKKPEEKVEDEVVAKVSAPEEFLKALTPALQEYFNLKEALVEEQPEVAAQSGARLSDLLKAPKQELLDAKAKDSWQKFLDSATRHLKTITETKEIQAQRRVFDPLSESFVKMVMGFRHVMGHPLIVFHCPMAQDEKGAYWIEASEQRRNPYFGHTKHKGQDMLGCAELIERIPPESVSSAEKTDSAAPSVQPDQEKQTSDVGADKESKTSPEGSDVGKKEMKAEEPKSETKAPEAKGGETHSHQDEGKK
jgi:Cu(I)/Ag(I) efflux system membrane fusion protein